MKANMLALTISAQYGPRSILEATAANIALLHQPADELVNIREQLESRPMVKFISIAGQAIELSPAMFLKDGTVSRTIKTPGHTHTLEITASFASGVVSSSLKSILDSTGEEVDLHGEWQITHVQTHYTRRNCRGR
ncbi:hypothetical protein D9M70_428830 [compost metagenome]